MSGQTRGGDADAQGALAAALELGAGRFHQDGEVTGEQVGPLDRDLPQAQLQASLSNSEGKLAQREAAIADLEAELAAHAETITQQTQQLALRLFAFQLLLLLPLDPFSLALVLTDRSFQHHRPNCRSLLHRLSFR